MHDKFREIFLLILRKLGMLTAMKLITSKMAPGFRDRFPAEVTSPATPSSILRSPRKARRPLRQLRDHFQQIIDTKRFDNETTIVL